MPEVPKIDEFAFVLIGGVLMLIIMAILYSIPAEAPPQVSPLSFEKNAYRGSTMSFDLTINGTPVAGKPALAGVNLTALGDIRRWISFNKQNFDVYEGDTVKVTIKVPTSAELGHNRGRIEIEGAGGTKSIYVDIFVIDKGSAATSRPIFLDDFSVSYVSTGESLDERSNVEVTKSYFGEEPTSLVGIVDDENLEIVEDGYIQLIIQDTNSAGNLIVSMNDEELYNEMANRGEVMIPLTKEQILKSNDVEIKADTPGMTIWATTSYDIRSAVFYVNYEGAFAEDIEFTLNAEEVEYFKNFNLFFRVKTHSKTLPPLMIKINDQIVYWESPPLAFMDEAFSQDMFGNPLYLNEGTNTISFNFEREGFYDLGEPILTVHYYSLA